MFEIKNEILEKTRRIIQNNFSSIPNIISSPHTQGQESSL